MNDKIGSQSALSWVQCCCGPAPVHKYPSSTWAIQDWVTVSQETQGPSRGQAGQGVSAWQAEHSHTRTHTDIWDLRRETTALRITPP